MKNKANKAEEALTELQNYLNGMLRLVKGLTSDSEEDGGGRCMSGSDVKSCVSCESSCGIRCSRRSSSLCK